MSTVNHATKAHVAAPEQCMSLTPYDVVLREKCRTLESQMGRLRTEIAQLDAERERTDQEWHEVTRQRHDGKNDDRIDFLKSEQFRLKGLVDQLKARIRRANEHLEELENDWKISRCDLL